MSHSTLAWDWVSNTSLIYFQTHKSCNDIWRRVDQFNFRFGDELTSRPRRRDDQGDELTCSSEEEESACPNSNTPGKRITFKDNLLFTWYYKSFIGTNCMDIAHIGKVRHPIIAKYRLNIVEVQDKYELINIH